MLYDFIINGRFVMKEFSSAIHMLNSVPTIIEEGNEKFVVFSHATTPILNKKQPSSDFLPSLFFYCIS